MKRKKALCGKISNQCSIILLYLFISILVLSLLFNNSLVQHLRKIPFGTTASSDYLPLTEDESLKMDNTLKILLWNKAYKKYIYPEGNSIFEECSNTNCYITHNKISVGNLAAVIVHGMKEGLFEKKTLQKFRANSEAVFIFQVREPPTLTGKFGSWSDNLFNLSMTYRADSEIDYKWATIVPTDGAAGQNNSNSKNMVNENNWMRPKLSHLIEKTMTSSILKKSGMLTWIVSKCATHSKREKLVENLKKYLKVDVYGRCGNQTIPAISGLSLRDPQHFQSELYQRLLSDYFFYLSFENSDHCHDYITEKLYYALNSTAVPIVYGSSLSDYEKIAPPHSFIHVDQFQTLDQLSAYLTYLTKNLTAYAEYFWWKRFYRIDKNYPACNLCKFLNDIKTNFSSQKIKKLSEKYESFNEYWWTGQCNNLKTKLSH